jgi:hypothetical protein
LNNLLIYADDELVDLYPNQAVSVTIKRFDVRNISSRHVNYTNSFKAPWTNRNKKTFGFAFDEQSNSQIPYTLIPAKLVQNGIEVLQSAFCYVKEPTKRDFNLAIVENIFNFFNEIKGKRISDVNPIPDSPWTASGIDSARTNTSGIISAILSWGKPGLIFQSDFFLPCFYYHTIVTSILQSTGLTLSGNILTDPRFTDLVVSFEGVFLYPESFVDPVKGKSFLQLDSPHTGITTGVDVPIDFNVILYGDDNFTSGGRTYNFPLHCNANIFAPVNIAVSAFNDGTTVTAVLLKNGVTILDTVNFTTPLGSQTLEYTGDFALGDYVEVITRTDAPVTGIDYTIGESSYMEVTPNLTINRDYVYWNQTWKDTQCLDIIEDFFTRFFIIPKQVGNVMYLKTVTEICNDIGSAIDWSGKVVNRDLEEISLDPELARQNWFRYSGDENLGAGSIDINNKIIEPSRDIFTSVFESSITQLVNFGYFVSVVPVYSTDSTRIDDMANEPSMRIFTLKPRTTEPAITFDVTPRSDFKLAYFVDSTQDKDTGFQYWIDQFYSEVRNALQLAKIMDKFFILKETDIANYDPHKMVWDGTSYSLVNIISNFIKDRITKVGLFKIS